ncbi:histidine kinase [Nonomuraea sp. NPDC050310]|uniref:sensor histidine kinase n=1 Tax=Nonomuraea sp. NPDC050310 TaxID=3154935 RepID=UPI0033E57898
MRWSMLARRWICLVFGGALLMPYMMAGEIVTVLYGIGQPGSPLFAVQPLIFLAALPVVWASGLVLPVRTLAAPAAQALLEVDVRRSGPQSRADRWRTAAWFVLHLGVGGVVSGCTLALLPLVVWTFVVPFTGDPWDLAGMALEPGWHLAWLPLAGLAALAVLAGVVMAGGAVLVRGARALLGPSAADRLREAEEQARALAERNRLAAELHDSVGHALSVVTLQAAAAGRVLERDPATARTALSAIEETARTALADLDEVLGILRADSRGRAAQPAGSPGHGPQPSLADLDRLVRGTGAPVTAEVGDLSQVPAVQSREAYRIVQESLTNAIKHGSGGPVRLAAVVRDGVLDLQVHNDAGEHGRARNGAGGRGLEGMRERVALLRGELSAGPVEGGWRVHARLPLRSTP